MGAIPMEDTDTLSSRGTGAPPGSPTPTVAVLPLATIRATALNPRPDPARDLAGLQASLGAPDAPRLAQFPLVEARPDGTYRLIAGERRFLAAQAAGWTHLPCIVYPPLDPAQAHRLRVRENLHHRPLDPLAEAAALKLSYLLANAQALGLGSAAGAVLDAETPPAAKIAPLLTLLRAAGWSESRPAVTWQQVLDDLGLDLDPSARKRRLRILNLDAELHAPLQELGLTESAVRALGAPPPDQQQTLVAEIQRTPQIAPKVRRISRVVRQKHYSLDEALDEARGGTPPHLEGTLPAGADSPPPGEPARLARRGAAPHREAPAPDSPAHPAPGVSPAGQEAITELLTMANRLPELVALLRTEARGGEIGSLPAPWGDYARSAVQLLQSALAPEE